VRVVLLEIVWQKIGLPKIVLRKIVS